MNYRAAALWVVLSGCSQGGATQGTGTTSDLAMSESPDGGGTLPDLMPAADLALPPAEGKPLWARSYSAQVEDVATAADGSIYLTGSFSNADFGDGPVSSSGSSDCFLIKFDKLGQRQWAKTFGRAYSDVPRKVSADKDGNVAVVGYSLRSAATGTHDAFVIEYTATGTQRFFRTYGGPTVNAVDVGISTGFAADGSLWVTGGFEDTIDFGGGTLTSAGSRDIYLLKLSTTGAHLLSKRFGFTSYDQSSGLAVMSDGDVVVAGTAGYPIDFGDGNVGTNPSVDAFLVRFAPDGVARWSKRFVQRQYSVSTVVAGNGGTIWYVGDFNGSVDFGGGPRTPSTNRAIFWAQYSGSGAHLGSFMLPSNNGIYLTNPAVDSTGQIVLGGRADGDIDFGFGNTVVTAGQSFLVKSAADGRVRWAHRFGGTSYDEVKGTAILPGDQVVGAGLVSKSTQVGTVGLSPYSFLLTLTP